MLWVPYDNFVTGEIVRFSLLFDIVRSYGDRSLRGHISYAPVRNSWIMSQGAREQIVTNGEFGGNDVVNHRAAGMIRIVYYF